jgi:hypothetical protein
MFVYITSIRIIFRSFISIFFLFYISAKLSILLHFHTRTRNFVSENDKKP